jgi:adenylate cyclase
LPTASSTACATRLPHSLRSAIRQEELAMTADTSETADGRSARLEAAFGREEYLGLRIAARVRAAGLAVIAVWISIENPFPDVLYFYVFVLLFGALGFAPLWLHAAGRYRRWMRYLFPLLDVSLFTYAVFSPNPMEPDLLPPQHMLRVGNEQYLFLFVAATVFTYSPAAVMWTGACAALVWSVATLRLALLPDSVGLISSATWQAMTDAEKVRLLVDPHRIYVGIWGREVVLLLLTAAALAVFVRRARRLVAQQAEAERQRANLSRYFSPNLVDQLAQADQALGPTRQQDVAVLFADIVGFTGLAEALPPTAVIDLLREYHGRMERLVFAHSGTVDKYIGDGLMATFGTPFTGPADAGNALRCAQAMMAAANRWNGERGAAGEAPIRVSFGLHYGSVVLGDIGLTCLEFAVIGSTVNAASRLETLTRALNCALVASDDLVTRAKVELGKDHAAFRPLVAQAAQTIRGLEQSIAIWTQASRVDSFAG